MTQIEQECTAALVQALLENTDLNSALLPLSCQLVAKTAPMTYMVKTPNEVIIADVSELRYAWR